MAHLPILFCVLVFALAVSRAALPTGQVYWNKVLPDTPIPGAIKDKFVGVGGVAKITPSIKPTGWKYYSEATNQDNPNTTLFFLEKDLHPGAKMTIHFAPATSGGSFISQQEASSIPFSSSKFHEILYRFSIRPDSLEATYMKETLSGCEHPAIGREIKHCATSLESMVEFSTSCLGTHNVQAVSTVTNKVDSPRQPYTIVSSGVRRLSTTPNLVVCHSQTYAYAIFYCHDVMSSRAYEVSMVGKDGTRVEAIAVCHNDTSAWNPKNIAFKALNVKPGTIPVCHFLLQDLVAWYPKS